METDYKLMSSANEVLLFRHKKTQTKFRIMFELYSNKPIEVADILNFSVYQDLYRLNKDIVEDVIISQVPNESDSRYVTLMLKKVGNNIGIDEKYISTKVKYVISNSGQCVAMVGQDITSHHQDIPSKFSKLDCIESKLFAFSNDEKTKITFQYDFHIEDPYFKLRNLQVPRAITDLSALLLKKAFIRMKEFKATELCSAK